MAYPFRSSEKVNLLIAGTYFSNNSNKVCLILY